MSKIMEMKELSNKVHRNGFDISNRVTFTANVGEILPIRSVECIPGDTHQIDLFSFGRTAPMQAANFGRIREYYDVYFVPNRLLWRHFNDWVLQGDNASFATGASSRPTATAYSPFFGLTSKATYDASVPTTQLNEVGVNRRQASDKLMRYLGYYNRVGQFRGLSVAPWRLLAYQKIYQDYFRFAQWEDVAPWTYNVDYMTYNDNMYITLNGANYANVTSMFDLRYCNYDKDMFHGIMPSPQFGDTALAGPLQGTLRGNITLSMSDGSSNKANVFLDQGDGLLKYEGNSKFNGTKNAMVYANLSDLLKTNSNLNQTGISVLAIRQAEMYQKWKEITLSSASRSVKDLLAKHWNVKVDDLLSNQCTYLGGIARNIDVNEVSNTNFENAESQAELRGKGISSNNGKVNFECKEYGTLMVIYHAKPLIEWKQSGIIDRSLLKVKPTDFAIPEFDSIGMQPVYKCECVPDSESLQVVGYAPRYIEYKTSFDVCLGEFEDTLESWVLPYEYDVNQNFDYRAFKVSPKVCDNLFGLSSETADQLRNYIDLQIRSVRNLDTDGLPY